jgi:serine/threonine-protein kinase RsbW
VVVTRSSDEARSLTVPAELRRLADVRAFVREAALAAGASGETVADAVQAVDEAATNVVVHGYAGGPGEIEVQSVIRDGRMEFRLLDRAPTFDPTGVPEPDLSGPPSARRPGGMGVHLIRAATDQTRHHPRPGGGNELVLVCAVERRPQEERAMALTIESVDSGAGRQVGVLALAGELDASNYESLIDRVAETYADGARALVLDLGGLNFMASSGLVALYSAVRIMRGEAPPDPDSGWGAIHAMEDDVDAESSGVRLASVQPPVDRVLDRTGLKRLFHVDSSRDEAVAALTGS